MNIEEIYRTVVENSPAGILIVGQDKRFLYLNEQLCRILGYTAEELVGQEFTMVLAEESRELVVDRYYRRQKGDEAPSRYEIVAVRKDGEKRILELFASVVVDSKTGLSSTVGQVLDITERKAADVALRQYTEELKMRTEELNAFAYTVAHDLKSPLTLIAGYASVLSRDFSALPSAEVKEYLETVRRTAYRMDRIIEELLLLSGLGRRKVDLQTLDMDRIVRNAWGRFLHLLPQTEVEFILPATWPQAVGHSPWVEEVWANYLSNAIKYGGNPLRIELGAKKNGDGKACFWVRDNGPGIPLEEHTQLFIPFTRLEAFRAKGHGLGLSIVRRIVERLGGEVSMESQLGQGSTFSFTLPLANS